MFHTIGIAGHEMCVMDDDGNVLAAAGLNGYRAAKQQIQNWTAEFTIDVAGAYRKLAAHFFSR